MNSLNNIFNGNFFPILDSTQSSFEQFKLQMETLCNEIRNIVDTTEFTVKTHIGVGTKSRAPWIGISFKDDNFDSSPQNGIYLALIFNVTGDKVILALGHGTDNSNKETIIGRTKRLKNMLVHIPQHFDQELIVSHDKTHKRPKNYELAFIYGKSYTVTDLDELPQAIVNYVNIYKDLIETLKRNDEDEYQSTAVNPKVKTKSVPSKRVNLPNNPTPLHLKKGPKRSAKEKSKALIEANGECTIDSQHSTFKTGDQANFLEAHHLIPMEYYYDFENSIDHWINIFALCPNCHRKIHFGKENDKLAMIDHLYEQRSEQLLLHYQLNKDNLKIFYGI